ncbi:MAG: hypothetical protein IIC73_05695, partial [Armatimonadetes bacterium]|nr:hypothetical protein [Armatimonadota bacterium]
LAIELGAGSAEAVQDLFVGAGWPQPEFVYDLSGCRRVAVLRRAGSNLP